MALLLDRRSDGRGAGIIATDLAASITQMKAALGPDEDEGSFDLLRSRNWLEQLARKIAASLPPSDIKSRDERVDLSCGSVVNRIYNPHVERLTVLLAHGGGWVIGSIDTHDILARWIAAQTGARVISIGYSLAPERPYPQAVNECREMFQRTIDAVKSPNAKLFVAGDSAGANIAAMSILGLDAPRKRKIAGFASIYGAYAPDMNLSSHRLYGDGRFGLSEAQMRWFWNLYAPQLAAADRDKLTPVAADLTDFPPTLCIGAECDLLLDDTLAFYSRLAGSNVDVTLSLWPNLPHGCLHFVGSVDSVTQAAGSIVQFVESRSWSPQTTRLKAEPSKPPNGSDSAPVRDAGAPRQSLIDVEPLFVTGRSRGHGSLAHKIAIAIIRGEMPPGELLPNEEKASASFGVSRSGYREAMRTLAAKGLVVALPKVGTRIAQRAAWQLLDPDILAWHFEAEPSEGFIRDLFELRGAVQPTAAILAAQRRDDEDVSDLADALARMARTSPNSGAWLSAIVSFHRGVLLATKNEAIASLWPAIGANIRWSMKLQMSLPSLKLVHDPVADNARVFETIASQNAAEAGHAMAALIEAALIDTLENLKRVKEVRMGAESRSSSASG
jgi:acetyl esterase/lipase/DNA-binding FadR family transcriptional regulator